MGSSESIMYHFGRKYNRHSPTHSPARCPAHIVGRARGGPCRRVEDRSSSLCRPTVVIFLDVRIDRARDLPAEISFSAVDRADRF